MEAYFILKRKMEREWILRNREMEGNGRNGRMGNSCSDVAYRRTIFLI